MASAPGACFTLLAAMIALPSFSALRPRDSFDDDDDSILPVMVSKVMDHERPPSSRSHPTDSTGQVSSLLQAARSGGTCSQWQQGICEQREAQSYSFGQGTGNHDQCLYLCDEAGATCCSYEYLHGGSSTCYAWFSYEFAWELHGSQTHRVPSARAIEPPIFRAGGGSWYSATCQHRQPDVPSSPKLSWEQKSRHLVNEWGQMKTKERARMEWELRQQQQQEQTMATRTSGGQRSPRTERSQVRTELHQYLSPHGNMGYNEQHHSMLPTHVVGGRGQLHSLQPVNMHSGRPQDSSPASKPKRTPDSEPEDGYDRFNITVRKTMDGPLSDPGIQGGFGGAVSEAKEILVNGIKEDGFIPDYNRRAAERRSGIQLRPNDIIYGVEVGGVWYTGNANIIGMTMYEQVQDECDMRIYFKRRKEVTHEHHHRDSRIRRQVQTPPLLPPDDRDKRSRTPVLDPRLETAVTQVAASTPVTHGSSSPSTRHGRISQDLEFDFDLLTYQERSPGITWSTANDRRELKVESVSTGYIAAANSHIRRDDPKKVMAGDFITAIVNPDGSRIQGADAIQRGLEQPPMGQVFWIHILRAASQDAARTPVAHSSGSRPASPRPRESSQDVPAPGKTMTIRGFREDLDGKRCEVLQSLAGRLEGQWAVRVLKDDKTLLYKGPVPQRYLVEEAPSPPTSRVRSKPPSSAKSEKGTTGNTDLHPWEDSIQQLMRYADCTWREALEALNMNSEDLSLAGEWLLSQKKDGNEQVRSKTPTKSSPAVYQSQPPPVPRRRSPGRGSGAQGETPRETAADKDVGDNNRKERKELSFSEKLEWMKKNGWEDEEANAKALEENNEDLNAVVAQWVSTYEPKRWGLVDPDKRPPA